MLLALLVALSPLASIRESVRSAHSRPFARCVAAATLPLAMLALYFSLCVHMRCELGSWPRTLGSAGFPDLLALHVEIAQLLFGACLLAIFFVLPVVALFCSAVPRWRNRLSSLAVHGASCSVCLGVTLLAPRDFLYWWWD